jgi:hypothetical protein
LIAEIVLLPPESKRLIGKAVAGMDSVREAKEKGILVICRGSTSSYVAEELMNTEINKGGYTAGYIGCKKSARVVIPVGLEKHIPVSVLVGARKLSSGKVDHSYGMPCGLVPIFGTTVTEVEAMKSMADVEIIPISAGGIGGAEGCIVFLIEGEEVEVRKILGVIEDIRGEGAVLEPA